MQDNIQKKGRFEKMFLEGRPPVNVGVTSGGDFFGNTQITFTDVLGDKQFNFYVESVSQYRTIAVGYTEPLAPAAVRAAGLLADAVLLRATTPAPIYAAQYGFLSHSDAHLDAERSAAARSS